MAKVTMYALANRQAVLTTYSGFVIPDPSTGAASVDVRDVATMMREGYSLVAGANNLSASADPTVGSDASAGYGPGSVWINQTHLRVWVCNSAAVGAAAWTLLFQSGS